MNPYKWNFIFLFNFSGNNAYLTMITLKSVPNQQAEFYFFNQGICSTITRGKREENLWFMRYTVFFSFEIVYSTCGGIFFTITCIRYTIHCATRWHLYYAFTLRLYLSVQKR